MEFLVVGAFCLLYMYIAYRSGRNHKHHSYTAASPVPDVSETDISFHGRTLPVTHDQLHGILMKRSPYYAALHISLQQKFRHRLEAFIRRKIFIIKDDEAFREMPVLISAAAIQITFGLRDYLLPFYRYIRVFPEEYVVVDRLKILAGNVQGNMITVAWTHFLDGFEKSNDGVNLGLHEMSHALYFQKVVIDEDHAKQFCRQYNELISECHEAHQDELEGRKDLYSDYASKDMQEFWAESVELFFEKPEALNEHYPDVFAGMIRLLNQDPRLKDLPVLKEKRDFREQMMQFRRLLRKVRLRNLDREATQGAAAKHAKNQ